MVRIECVYSSVEQTRATVVVDKRVWEIFRTLKDPTGNRNASYHLREAMRLYLKLLEVESSKKIFEDQEPEESLHATSSFGRASV